MWNGCASGEPPIPVTGNDPRRPRNRYMMSATRKYLHPNRFLHHRYQTPCPHRYKISPKLNCLCSWDLSPSSPTPRYKRTSPPLPAV